MVFFLFAIEGTVFCQSNASARALDSLMHIYKSTTTDSTKINALIGIAGLYIKNNPDTCIICSDEALKLSQKINWPKGMAKCYMLKGLAHKSMSNYDTAMVYQRLAFQYYTETHDSSNMALVLNNIGLPYNSKSDYITAFVCYNDARKIALSINDSVTLGKLMVNIGLNYYHQKKYDLALNYYNTALVIQSRMHDVNSVGNINLNIGLIHDKLNRYDSALFHYNVALEIYTDIGNKNSKALVNSNIGNTYSKKGEYVKALMYHNIAQPIFVALKDKNNTARGYSNMAETYLMIVQDSVTKNLPDSLKSKTNLLQQAEIFLQQAIAIKQQIGDLNGLQNSYSSLSNCYRLMGNYKNAFDALQNNNALKDSIFKIQSNELVAELELKNTASINNKEARIQELELNASKRQRWFLIAVMVLLANIFAMVIYYYRNRQQKRIIKMRNSISRDLHDEVGSSLSSIALYGDVAIKKMKDNPEESSALLQKIKTTTTSIHESINDIVWSIGTRNDKFENIINRMRDYASQSIEQTQATLNFEVIGNFDNVNLSMIERKNIYLIFKEAINNCVKYAQCKNVNVIFSINGKKLSLIIKDDGLGFSTEEYKKKNGYNGILKLSGGGTGLSNMKQRADEINAEFKLGSEVNKGTEIIFSMDVTT
ncbi:MAG: tetratricopeptide repeat protein [Bacteroidetes bacterium]|nr:tetratricopeptide repeat protein [Bacteroidota bacterium]